MDLPQLDRLLDLFRVFHPTHFPLHFIQIFAYVAKHGRVTYRDIEEALNLTNGSVSRAVHALGETHRNGHPGLGVLQVSPDPDEGRRLQVHLSAKGQALLRQIKAI